MNLIQIFLIINSLICITFSAKILGVFPTMAKSHYIVGSALMKGLAEKGHEVTVISPFPQKSPIKNYRDINTPGVIEKTKHFMDNILDMSKQNVAQSLFNLFGMGLHITNLTMQEPSVQQLLKSKEKYDLVIMEIFVNEAHLGFGKHFNAPVVGVSTFGANMWNCDMIGSPSPPSFVPHPFLSFTDRMSFLQRVANILLTTFERVYIDYFYIPLQQKLMDEGFPNLNADLVELRKNVSLILLNNHFSISSTRPYVPNMIEVGGMHINRKPKSLPADIKQFIDSAKDGVVYFSMGSNLKSKLLPSEKREQILSVFKSLKQKVLWKWEDKVLPNKPDNVFISDWFPQDDILAHPNVKLFITHGGLLSTTEAVFHGVPVVGIPMFGDQFLNMAKAERAGFGLTVQYESLTKETLGKAVNEILRSNAYHLRVKNFSERYRDQPSNPLDTAIYWVEYVIRHKGAQHLHSAAVDLSFIQYHNIDVFTFIFGAIFLVLYVTYRMIKKLLLLCFVSTSKTKKSQKKKAS